MANYITLHVVFAGRGDMLILEHDEADPQNPNLRQKVLTLMDGGPLYKHGGQSLHANSHANVSLGVTESEGAAPYYKHLIAALREIWGPANPLVIRCMINTHPDDDHYGGLLRVLGRHQNQANAINPTFRLHGSFYTPYWPNDSSFQMISATLRGWGMTPTNATQNPSGSRTHIQYPALFGNLVEFNRLPANQKPALDQGLRMNGTDAHDKNDGSILSIASDANNMDAILFTGDGSAHRIEAVINDRRQALNTVPNQPPPDYWIPLYKIQHHGGHLKQHPDWTEFYNYSNDFFWECKLYAMLSYHLGHRMPWNKKYVYSFIDLLHTNEYLTFLVQHCLNHGRDPADLYNILQSRRQEYANHAMRINYEDEVPVIQDANGQWQEIKDTFGRLVQKTMAVPADPNNLDLVPSPAEVATYDTEFKRVYGHEWDHVWGRARKKRGNQFRVEHWFSRWNEIVFYEPFLRDHCEMNLSGQICQFFLSFQAEAYVVSGSYEVHGHPKVPTLMGLAHAVRLQQRRVTLWMTDPRAIFSAHLDRACWFAGFTVAELFCGQHLQVRYLATRPYMSLNASRQAGLFEMRDLGPHTEGLLNLNNPDGASAIVGNLEKTAQVRPALDTTDPNGRPWMMAARDKANRWWYMKLVLDANLNTYTPQFFRPLSRAHLNNERQHLLLYVSETADLTEGTFRVRVSLQQNLAWWIELEMMPWSDLGTVTVPSWQVKYTDAHGIAKVVARSGNTVDIVTLGEEERSAPVLLSGDPLPAWHGLMVNQINMPTTSSTHARDSVPDNNMAAQQVAAGAISTGRGPLLAGKGVIDPLDTSPKDPSLSLKKAFSRPHTHIFVSPLSSRQLGRIGRVLAIRSTFYVPYGAPIVDMVPGCVRYLEAGLFPRKGPCSYCTYKKPPFCLCNIHKISWLRLLWSYQISAIPWI